jgi:hypothetical protein
MVAPNDPPGARGRFDTTAGTVVVSSDPAQCSVDVSIDASSLSTQNGMRDADVKGPDFFDAGMTRELLSEIGEASSEPDVWIEIDCEAVRAEAAAP